MSDLKIQGVVEMSSEGAERALDRVADKAGQMSSRLEKEGEKAGKAVDGIGAGAKSSADEFTRAEGKIVASIKRVNQNLEQVGKTASQKIELRIADKGLDPAKFEPMLRKLRELEVAQTRTAAGSAQVAAGYSGQFSNNVRNVSYQLQDFTVQVNGGVDAAKALGQQLPQLLFSFGTAGAVIGVVAALLPNLVQAFSSSAGASKTLGDAMGDFDKAISAVGETVKEFDMDKVYVEFNNANTATRAAIGEQLRFQQAFIETSRLVAGKKFGESLSGVGEYGTLDKLAGAFGTSGAERLAKQLGIGLETAKDLLPTLSGLKSGTEDVNNAFQRFGTALIGGNASAVKLATGMAELAKSEREAAGASSAISEAQVKMATGHAQTKKEAEAAAAATKSLGKEQAALADLLNTINAKDTGLDANYIKNVELLLGAYGKGKLTLAEFNEVFARYVALQPAAKAAAKDRAQAQEDYTKALQSALGPLETQAQNLEREVANYGLAESAIQGTIVARIEEARALAALNGAWPEHLAYLDQEIEYRKRIASASSQKDFLDANKRAAEQSAKEWEKFSDDINRALTDALMRGFEDGKNFGQNFVDTLKNTLKTTLLKIGIQYVVTGTGSLAGAASNAIFGTSFSSGNSAGGSGSSILGDTSSAMSLYNAGNALYGYGQAAYAGYGMTAEQAAAAAQAYWSAGNYGTSMSLQAGNYLAPAAQTTTTGVGLGATATETTIDAGLLGSSAPAVGTSIADSFMSYLAGGSWVFAVPAIAAALNQTKTRYEDTSISGSYVDGKFIGELIDKYKTASNGFNAAETNRVITPISGDLSAMTNYYTPTMVQQALDFTAFNRLASSDRDGGEVSDDIYAGQLAAAQITGTNDGAQAAADAVARTGAIKDAFDNIYTSIKDGLVRAGNALWDSSFAATLEGFALDVSVKGIGSMQSVLDMTAEQLSSGMSSLVLPSINDLKTSTESWGQSLTRLLAEANSVAGVMDLLGGSIKDSFGENNADAILRFSDSMVKAFGSIDQMNASVSSYYSNYYSAEEVKAQKLEALSAQFSAINQVIPQTREEFRALVDGLDKASPTYATTFKNLLDLSSGFADLTPAIGAAVSTVAAAVTDLSLQKSWQDKLDVLTGSKTQLQVDRANDLASTTDTAAQAIMRLVFAQEDLATSATKSAEATAAAAAASAEAAAKMFETVRTATLASFDASRSSIQSFASAGLANITEAINLEKTRLGVIKSVAQESVSGIKGIFSLLSDQVSALYGTVSSTSQMQAAEGNAFIANALSNAQAGYLPDRDALSEAISGARSGLDVNNFATQFEADRAALVMAGQLSQIKDLAGSQLPAAEQAVKLADEQLKALDDSLDYYKKQLNQLQGINDNTLDFTGSVQTVGDAIVRQLSTMTTNLSAGIISALKGGSITSGDAVNQLKASGVATDATANVGSSTAFLSQNGASIVDGLVYTTNGFKGSLTEAKDIITAAFNGLSPKDFQAKAIEVGLSAAMIDRMYSFEPGWTNKWASANGLPAFAVGTNYVPKDMLAQIHEGEAIIPKAYNPAANGGNSRLEKLVEGLTAEVQRLQTIVDTGNKHASRTANAVNGNPEQPMLVETV